MLKRKRVISLVMTALIMGILMILSIIILLSNLLADILYAIIDPKIRYDK